MGELEKWHQENCKQFTYNRWQRMAGYEELERFGIQNILPTLVSNFGICREKILAKMNIIELLLEVQRLSVKSKIEDTYNELLKRQNK